MRASATPDCEAAFRELEAIYHAEEGEIASFSTRLRRKRIDPQR